MEEDGQLVAHASVVRRAPPLGDRLVETGYMEAVATRTGHRRRGYASAALAEVAGVIGDGHRLGALSTRVRALFERLGWERWEGPTFVSTPACPCRTPDDDGGDLVLRTPASGAVDRAAAIACDWRHGDVW
jgi:aminoglycoside 2'-N-acetyltransferase I